MSDTNTTPEPRLHSVPHACERLDLSRNKVFRLLASGELRSIKVGHRRLIPESALVEFIEGPRAGRSPQAG